MKAQTLLALASLSLSSLVMAGDFHGHFDSLGTSAETQHAPVVQQTTRENPLAMTQQDIFEQNNNWHFQHPSR